MTPRWQKKKKNFRKNLTYSQTSSKNSDLPSGLLLALSPLYQIEAIVYGQGDVPFADGGVHCTGEKVRLCLKGDLHAVG